MSNFISYWTGKRDNSFGFMCYRGTMTEESLKDRLFSKDAAVIVVKQFKPTNAKQVLVSFMTDGVFKHEILDFPVNSHEDIDRAWCELLANYDDVHILSFSNITDEFKR